MIDYFALALSHGLLLIAALRLLASGALDRDPSDDAELSPEQEGEELVARPAAGPRKRRRDA